MSEKVVTKFLDFNSCIPYGMQPVLAACYGSLRNIFQFMHPLWDATRNYATSYVRFRISIHASREGCNIFMIHFMCKDKISIHASFMGCNRFLHLQTDFSQFQFMHPIRDATMSPIRLRISRSISIHALRVECNSKV